MVKQIPAVVAARGAHFDSAESPEPGRTLEVSVVRQDDGFAGSFQVSDRSTHGPRKVASRALGSRCCPNLVPGEKTHNGSRSREQSPLCD